MPSYPTKLNSANDLLLAQNNWTSQTAQPVGRTDSEISILNANGLQPADGVLSIDDEVIRYRTIITTGRYPLLVGCTRGADGTEAATHDRGATVEDRWVAIHNNILVSALTDLINAIGTLPQYDPSSGEDFGTLSLRLNRGLPLLATMPLLDTWVAVHSRKRVVAVHLFKDTPRGVEPFTAPIWQQVNPLGTSTVTVELGTAESGYLLLQ